MNNASIACPASADADFGPIVNPKCRQGFDFTLLFEQVFFVVAPQALLVLVTPLRVWQLLRAPVRVKPCHLGPIKLIVAASLAILQVALIALWASRGSLSTRLNRVSLASACVSVVSSLACCAISYFEHVKSPRPSSLLNVFLLASLLLDSAVARTLWLASVDLAIKAIFSVAIATKATLLVLEAQDKRRLLIDSAETLPPEETTGLYGRAVFSWVLPLLRAGFVKLLRPEDLFPLGKKMGAAFLSEKFQNNWKNSSPGAKHRLIRCCVLTLRVSLLTVVLPRLCLLAVTICQPLVLTRFLGFLDDQSQPNNVGYGLIAAYGFVYLGIALSQALYWHQNARFVSMLRSFLVTAIFGKLMALDMSIASDAAAVTLMSSDVEVIVRAAKEINELWANVLQVSFGTWLLAREIGYAAVGPIIVSGVALAMTTKISPLAMKSRVTWLEKTQKRIGITSSMIGHIKSIKMAGLSTVLYTTISSLRLEEIAASRPFRTIGSITSSMAQIPVFISPVVAFAIFQGVSAQTGLELNPTRLFTALALITLQTQPLFWMFELVLDLSAAHGATSRIEKFLLQPDRQLQSPSSQISLDSGTAIHLENASFGWKPEIASVSNVSVDVQKGQLAMVVGPVASGKSTLLHGIIRETPYSNGVVQLAQGKLSWCGQTMWAMNQTMQANILGPNDFNESLYTQIIEACDLNQDFDNLPLKDKTLVGSSAAALSGGQKQRMALARALYSRPEIAVFDDVLSGLDNTTAQRVFEKVFSSNGLLRQWNTTIVLATQSVSFLSHADTIISLSTDGIPTEIGTYPSLIESGGYVASLAELSTTNIDDGMKTVSIDRKPEQEASQPVQPTVKTPDEDKRRQLGDKSVYRYYFGSVGVQFSLVLLFLELVWTFLQSFPALWLKFWSDTINRGEEKTGLYLGVYAALQIAGVCWFSILIWFVLVRIAAKSGIHLHQKLLSAVLHAPLSLFTNTDVGSITTRFSQDIGMIDNQLPLALVVTLASLFTVLAKAGLLAASTYYVAISFPLLAAAYYFLQRGYLRTSRQLRMMDLELKAPIYTQFLESLSGLSTIRAFGWTEPTMEQNHHLVDASQQPFYLLIVVQKWLVLVLDLMTAALALLVVGFAVHLRSSVSIALTGVSLVQLISMSETLNMLMQFWTSIETSISAVARIKQFAESTGNENLPCENGPVPTVWLNRGHVSISGLSASYDASGDTKALDGIDLDIKPGEKIAICGRTGSGKSSLMLSILRMMDYINGSIIIDDVSIDKIPRDKIRDKIITVGQEQFVLPGSIRYNIDPTNQYPTQIIINALTSTGLWETVESNGGLDAELTTHVFSHGQRQLFFLARAIVKKDIGKLLLLDEVTSSIDAVTEEKVRKVIEDEFHNHTVISIAHRLETIVDFNKVAVLDDGKLVEFGEPRELLRSQSRFRGLWDSRSGAPCV